MASLIVTPVSVGTLLGALAYGLCERRSSHVALGFLGAVLTTVGVVVVMPAIGSDSHLWFAIVGGTLVGLGSGTLVTANGATILTRAPQQRLGVVSAVRVLVQLTGITLGTALALAVVASPLHRGDQAAFYGGVPGSISAAGLDLLPYGYYAALGVLAFLSLASAITALGWRSSEDNTNTPHAERGPSPSATTAAKSIRSPGTGTSDPDSSR